MSLHRNQSPVNLECPRKPRSWICQLNDLCQPDTHINETFTSTNSLKITRYENEKKPLSQPMSEKPVFVMRERFYQRKRKEIPLSDCLSLMRLRSKEDSLKNENESHGQEDRLYEAVLKKESFLKGASSARMLAKIKEKAKSMKEKYTHISRKKTTKPLQAASDYHTAKVSPVIVKQHNLKMNHELTNGMCVSSFNMVKSFSKYPDSIPSSEQIFTSKQYEIYYEWKDVHPFVSVSNASMFNV